MKQNEVQLKSGDVVYLRVISGSNAARRIKDQADIASFVKEAVVVTIGRTYVTVRVPSLHDDQIRFRKEDWSEHTVYSPNYILFSSRQAALEDIEAERLWVQVRRRISEFGSLRPNLEQIRAIAQILSVDDSTHTALDVG